MLYLLDKTGYIILAVAIVVALVAIFIVSFVLYRKTPPPKGCEDLKPDATHCGACGESGCFYYKEYHDASKTDEKKEEKK